MPNRFQGKQGKGSYRNVRVQKRAEAEARNALTPPERRRKNRKAA